MSTDNRYGLPQPPEHIPYDEQMQFTSFMRFFRASERADESALASETQPPPPPRKLGTIEHLFVAPISFATRMTALVVALTIWIFPIAPVWLVILLRTIAVFSVATVHCLFSGKNPPDEQRLNYVSAFWISGFFQILNTFIRGAPLHEIFLRPSQWHPVEELIIACLFYLCLFTSIAYLNYWLALLYLISYGLWVILVALYSFAVWAMQNLWQLF